MKRYQVMLDQTKQEREARQAEIKAYEDAHSELIMAAAEAYIDINTPVWKWTTGKWPWELDWTGNFRSEETLRITAIRRHSWAWPFTTDVDWDGDQYREAIEYLSEEL